MLRSRGHRTKLAHPWQRSPSGEAQGRAMASLTKITSADHILAARDRLGELWVGSGENQERLQVQPSCRNPESSLPRVPRAARGEELTPCALCVAVPKARAHVLCASHQTHSSTDRSWSLVCRGQTRRYQSSFLPVTSRAALEPFQTGSDRWPRPGSSNKPVSVPPAGCVLQRLVLRETYLLHCLYG